MQQLDPIVARLDPMNTITYKLGREAMSYEGGLKKDLTHLNRDPAKVVVLDWNEDYNTLQPDNFVKMKKWRGEPDNSLVDIVPFLEGIAGQYFAVSDVRPVIAKFRDTDIPVAYAKFLKSLRPQKESLGWLRSMFAPAQDHGNLDDQILREREGAHELFLRQQSENQEYHKAQVEQMSVVMEKVQEEVRTVRTTLWKMMTVGAPGKEPIYDFYKE